MSCSPMVWKVSSSSGSGLMLRLSSSCEDLKFDVAVFSDVSLWGSGSIKPSSIDDECEGTLVRVCWGDISEEVNSGNWTGVWILDLWTFELVIRDWLHAGGGARFWIWLWLCSEGMPWCPLPSWGIGCSAYSWDEPSPIGRKGCPLEDRFCWGVWYEVFVKSTVGLWNMEWTSALRLLLAWWEWFRYNGSWDEKPRWAEEQTDPLDSSHCSSGWTWSDGIWSSLVMSPAGVVRWSSRLFVTRSSSELNSCFTCPAWMKMFNTILK